MFAILSDIVLYIRHPVTTTNNNNVGESFMLPRKLYELLPFLYMLTGVVCALIIDSTVVLISAMLLILAGVFVFLMRRSYRKMLTVNSELYKETLEPCRDGGPEKRSGFERRHRTTREWPIHDDVGDRVFSDRRIGERRISAV